MAGVAAGDGEQDLHPEARSRRLPRGRQVRRTGRIWAVRPRHRRTTTGSVYTFTKNEDYWDAANYPYKKLVVKVFANDAAAVAALKTGQIDAGLVGSADVEQVKGGGLDIQQLKGQTTRLMLTDHLGKVRTAR